MSGSLGYRDNDNWFTEISSRLGSGSSVVVIERVTRGFGDAIMLRPGIVAFRKQYPNAEIYLHIREPEACVFSDIDGINIVPIPTFPDDNLEGKIIDASDKQLVKKILDNRNKRERYSSDIIKTYKEPIYYSLSTPCAEYETKNQPHIFKSRQEIFCEKLNVPFDISNYEVRFTEDEEKFADDFLGGISNAIGIHMRTADSWRDYKYMVINRPKSKMWDLVEHIARRYSGYVITFDKEWFYEGKLKNIKSLIHNNFRYVWAVMSRVLLGIGPDSVGVHAFGSACVPTYGMFGPTDPRVRLLYLYVAWSDKSGCPYNRQYCWYTNYCRRDGVAMAYCLNSKTPKYYWDDIKRKMGRYLK